MEKVTLEAVLPKNSHYMFDDLPPYMLKNGKQVVVSKRESERFLKKYKGLLKLRSEPNTEHGLEATQNKVNAPTELETPIKSLSDDRNINNAKVKRKVRRKKRITDEGENA